MGAISEAIDPPHPAPIEPATLAATVGAISEGRSGPRTRPLAGEPAAPAGRLAAGALPRHAPAALRIVGRR